LVLLVLGALGVALALVQSVFTEVDFPKLSGLAFLLTLVVSTAALVVLRLSPLKSTLYLACLSYVVFVGIGPLIVPPGHEDPARVGDAWPIVASWLGLLTMALGYLAGKQIFRSPKASFFPGVHDSLVKLERFGLTGGVLIVLGLIGVVLWLGRIGGVGVLQSASYAQRPSRLWYEAGLSILVRPGLVLLLGANMAKARVSFGKRLLLFILVLGDLTWEGPLAGSRLQLITMVLSVGCLLYLGQAVRQGKARLFPYGWLFLAGLSFALVWGPLRNHSISKLSEMSFTELGHETADAPTFLAAYSTYEAYVQIVQMVPGSIAYQWGASIWNSLTVWIPREYWASKPAGLGDQLTMALTGVPTSAVERYGPGNTAPTAPGELYLNFGLPGLLIGMFLLGAGCAWMAQWISRLPSEGVTASLILYAVMFPAPFAVIWGGSIQMVWSVAVDVLPIYVFFLLARVAPRSDHAINLNLLPQQHRLRRRQFTTGLEGRAKTLEAPEGGAGR
jgi:hypothetical protein